ncbi:CDP-alcohol phosphatidyltransferase family protein [Pseudorhodoplanes sinuspersici]|uniref:CDP-diacylglycerol--glycerol-3-phosphate 3-phosphatidyltransferase n=1 Tax=Pseudorhodoplanes sinuspersici TaxID=1235591 RepID=A0A1W6ZXM7_9HYPH|nr:CDP-alcohol phosphatidyltransferase family protein [Pseudorhodoplanes sinuspersici]ARQ02114.1 CDP-alcohol phosphatidyltransferase [Pseudorhodoplanes sinuspersici]RKE73917.1 cardiolipin synthase [Pseudorhodoplanes sinuspersici]
MNLPNLITMARILSVPLIVWTITSGHMLPAFLLFLTAGLSDAVDGFLAKRFNMATELGAMLDPLADKALIVSIYVALSFSEALPLWVVILVVSRDILIIGGFLVAMMIDRPMPVRPHPVSKLNTVAQILLAGMVLASLGLNFDAGWIVPALIGLVTILTLLSIGFYVAEWIRHFGTNGSVD